uniref:HSF-type DNA-binding domain-containing protein n=1 Tax=Chrysotila carterae TaxID=13221 RepID=A0A7S4B1F2_CHRCT
MTGSSLPTTLEQALQPSHEARTICEPNEPFRIVHVNDLWCQTCGYDAEEVLGLTCKVLQGVGTCRATLSMLRQALLLKRNFAVQLLNYTKRGRPFMNTLQVTPLVNAEGHVTHYLGVIIARFLDGAVSVPAAVQQSSKSGSVSLGMNGWSDHGSSSATDDVVMELAPGDSSTPSEEGSSSCGWAPSNGRVPPFLTKLSEILSKEPSEVITSTPETSSFRIWDSAKFAKEVLPQYFKHNKLGSFSQQLHTYGFRRKPNSSSTDLSVEFYHDQYSGPAEKFLDWIRAGGAQSKRSNHSQAKEAPPPSCVDSPPPPQLLEDLVVVAEGTRQLAQVFNQVRMCRARPLASLTHLTSCAPSSLLLSVSLC